MTPAASLGSVVRSSPAARGRLRWPEWSWLAVAVAIVLSAYAWILRDARQELGADPRFAYYNLLVQGFRSGHLYLPTEPPAELARLPDPFDPAALEPYRGLMYTNGRIHDLSYFHGRLYLYFGITPALVLFAPAVLLAGVYLSHAAAIAIFALVGFAASGGIIVLAWRRYFGSAPAWLAAGGVTGVGLATTMPLMLQRPEVWEVAITCGYAMLMLTLLALWQTLHHRRKTLWLTLASSCYGLALGARPSLLLVAPILFVPVWFDGRRGEREDPTDASAGSSGRGDGRRLFLAAAIPVTVIGLGLLAYNDARFGSLGEFGQHYQLAGERQMRDHFSWRHFPTNFRVYFLRAATWTDHFPFFKRIPQPDVALDHGDVELPYGILTNTPWMWLALAVPLAWCGVRSERSPLRVFALMVAGVFVIMAVANTCYYGACVRYEEEFTPALALLAAIGWFGLHDAWRARRRALAHALAVAALAYAAGFTMLYGWIHRSFIERGYASVMLSLDRNPEALAALQRAVRYAPDFGELHFMLGCALTRTAHYDAGRAEVVRGVQLNPSLRSYFVGFYGQELSQAAPPEQELGQLERIASELPTVPEAQNLLGNALADAGRADDALEHFRAAVRLNPKFSDAYCSIGILLARRGEFQPAVDALETALQLNPKLVDAHVALARLAAAAGNKAAARFHFQAAIDLDPHAEEAREALRQLSP